MFNIKRALTATVLSAALAGGAMVLGASTASASAAAVGISASPNWDNANCVMVRRGKLDFIPGKFERSVKITYKGGQYQLKKKRQCTNRVDSIKW